MALSSRDLTCVVCEDVFSEPVSTPCGHNFCQSCISVRWRDPGPHQCPVCSKTFPTRPPLHPNKALHSMVQHYRQSEESVYGAPDSVYGAPGSVYGAPGSVYGARADYKVNGARPQGSVLGAWSDYSVNGARPEGTALGARAEGTVLGARSDYSVNGARAEGTVLGARSDYSVNGARPEGTVLGARPQGSVLGARAEGTVLGARSDYSVNGARPEGTVLGARSDYSVNGAQSVYSLGDMWSDYGPSKPRQVWCDFCAEPKSPALKFCQDCSTSLCEAHLQPHSIFKELMGHHLQEPGDQHDQVQTVSTPDPKPDLRKKDPKPEDPTSSAPYTLSSRKVQLRVEKMAQVRAVLERSQQEADHKAAEVVAVLHAVVQDVQTSLDRFTQVLEEVQTQAQAQAGSMVQELQREVKELQEREAGEALVFIHRNSQPLQPVALKDWDGVSLAPPPLEPRVSEVVSALEERVSERLRSLRLSSDLAHLRSLAVSLTLDPDTAHHRLVLSRGDTAVHYGVEKRKRRSMKGGGDRFRQSCSVLTRQRFSSGRFYFQVQVSGKSDWDVGVARSSVNRKKKVPLCPANGFWVLWLRDGTRYQALEALPVAVVPGRPLQTVGVFVDCDVGVVSFYDADTAAPLYSFSDCAFRGAVLPVLNPCLSTATQNSAPLVLTPVQQRPLQGRKELPGEQRPLQGRKELPGEQRPLQGRKELPGEQRPLQGRKELPGEQRPLQGRKELPGEQRPLQGRKELPGEQRPLQGRKELPGEQRPLQGRKELPGEQRPLQGRKELPGEQRPLQGRKELPGEQRPLQGRKELPGEQRPLQGRKELPGEQRPLQGRKELPGEQRPRLELQEPLYYSFGS